jgi:hypothetical protein
METLLTYFHAKGSSPMTLRWTTSIAALAFLALAATLISANASWAAEPEVQKLAAGPGDSPSPGDADTTPGDDSDAAPSAAPGDDQAPEGAEPGKDAGAPPAEETAEPKEAAPDAKPEEKAEEPEGKPEEQAAPDKDDYGTEGKEEEQAAPANDDGEGGSRAPAASKEADAEALPLPRRSRPATFPFQLIPSRSPPSRREANCSRCHQVGRITAKNGKPKKTPGNVLLLDDRAEARSMLGNRKDQTSSR